MKRKHDEKTNVTFKTLLNLNINKSFKHCNKSREILYDFEVFSLDNKIFLQKKVNKRQYKQKVM
jgi:hypothetical protein